MSEEKTKPWWKSKSIVGALLWSISVVLQAVSKYLVGELDPGTFVNQLLPQIGIITSIIGLRTAKKDIK